MMQSTAYSAPATTTPRSLMRSTPLPSVSTSVVFGELNACRYSSWKQGRLHSWRYQALSFCAVSRSCDDGVDAGADLLHLLEVGVLEGGQHVRRRHLLARQAHDPRADAARQVGPAVLHQILLSQCRRPGWR